ncbi:MAG: phasin family protein [Holosporaceae bacterium]|jgi:hypothetical protein|nr:phasin family protein [Holosporaceae bacterium]
MTTTDAKGETFAGCKMPKIDPSAFLDSYKKNLEILGLINKMSIEVCNGIVKLQSAFFKQFMSDLGSVAEKAAKPSEAAARFNEVVRDNIVKAVGNSQQIANMITENANELNATLSKRFKETVAGSKPAADKK